MDQISPGLQSALASWVNTKNMQPIVDKITPLIWTDINIVNADSIIVASSKPYRIGKYHNAAHMLLDTDQDELHRAEGRVRERPVPDGNCRFPGKAPVYWCAFAM